MKDKTIIDLVPEKAHRNDAVIAATTAVFTYARTGRTRAVATVALCNDRVYTAAHIPPTYRERMALVGALESLKAAILAEEPGFYEDNREE